MRYKDRGGKKRHGGSSARFREVSTAQSMLGRQILVIRAVKIYFLLLRKAPFAGLQRLLWDVLSLVAQGGRQINRIDRRERERKRKA